MQIKIIITYTAVAVLFTSLISQSHSYNYTQWLADRGFLSFFKKVAPTTSTTTTTTTKRAVVNDKGQNSAQSRADLFYNFLINRQPIFSQKGSGANNNSAGNSDKNAPENPVPTTTVKTSTGHGYVFNWGQQNRPWMIPFPTKPQTEINDKQHQVNLADLILQSMIRPPILELYRSNKSRSTHLPFSNNQAPPSEKSGTFTSLPTIKQVDENTLPQNNGVVVVDPYGGVHIVNSFSTASPTNNDKQANGDIDVQDKPFYGDDLASYFTSSGHDNGSQNQTKTSQLNGRYRRDLGTTPKSEKDNPCTNPKQFEPCQYFPRCFPGMDDQCEPRESYMGDNVATFCQTIMETVDVTTSELLKTYLKNIELCLRIELMQILESPSCSDVTIALATALFGQHNSSCLFQDGMFCKVTEDHVARPDLARMLNKPKNNNIGFMMKLLVFNGKLAYNCQGSGASIFLTDLVHLATTKGSPYEETFSSILVPGN